jgi:hypothetical protein
MQKTIFKTISAFIFLFLTSPNLFAEDLSQTFLKIYQNNSDLGPREQKFLQSFDFYLVPGILSETFIADDGRSHLDFTVLTGDYFGAQKKLLSKKYHFSVKRLSSSSKSVDEIKANIRAALAASHRARRKAIFISHSLGGLGLLEELVSNEQSQKDVAGIIFLESPFYGSPVADVYFESPYDFVLWLAPILPFVNTREETIRYLSTKPRTQFMNANKEAIRKLVKRIPAFTVGGAAKSSRSLFKPAIDLIGTGCIRDLFARCMTPDLFAGPYDQSDGMVPFESSKLENVDYIKLEGVDHGEMVVRIPFKTYDTDRLTVGFLKILLSEL